MADLDVNSPGLFAGLDADLDAFAFGNGTPRDSNLADESADANLGISDPTTASAGTVASSSTVAETPTNASVGGTSSASPSAVTAPQHQQHQQQQPQPQPNFYNPPAPQWIFQDTPPYDSPATTENPFGPVPPVPQQSWELPVHLNLSQPLLQQPSLYLQSATAASDPNLGFAPNAPNAPGGPGLAPNALQARFDNQRNIQNTLTPAQRERLRTIAMPPHLQYHSPNSADSPDSTSSAHEKGSPDAVDPTRVNSRKRKSSADVDDEDDDDDFDGQHPVKKTAHNEIEKRYRTNLNDKIAALRDSVPSLRIMCKSARGEDTTEDREELHGLTPAHKLNKATVLSKATEYIRHLEKRNNRLIDENSGMQARIAAFEKLFMAGAITGQLPNPLQQPPTPMQFPQDTTTFMNSPMGTPRGPDPPGMIPIPDDMKRILTAQQMNAGRPYPVPAQHFGQNPTLLRQQQIQQQQQQAQASRWNPYFGKLMVGTLAGLMLVEAVVENEQSSETTEGRGLFALPVQLLTAFVRSTHFSIGGYYVSALAMIAKLRLLSLVGFFLWVACPSLFDTSIFRPSEKTKQSTSVVQAVPSLASPIHVRRQAWLTAIQTVWVPRHNFFLEAAALMLKTIKYALRNAVGSHGYLALTGLSEEQEAARVKAWSIALDAQLAGGDVEINKSRLTLTLLASGTLPDTPIRLMMKALHIRVLLWRLNGASWAANLIAAKLARSRWNEARQLNRILNSLVEDKTSHDEALPEHLAMLLEQDCDEVLNDDIIQRAHNLAWNKPTTYNVVDEIDGMDTVVEDAAVRSPMDAVAAWYSSFTLHHVLVNSLSKPQPNDPTTPTVSTTDAITLAIRVAPIGSNAQVRALVARAVLVENKRGASIVAALQALGPSANPDKHPRFSRAVPPLIDSPMTTIVPDPDALLALRCAMGVAQLTKFADPPRAAYGVIEGVAAAEMSRGVSLLGYVAALRLMETLFRHPVGREACVGALERLAGGLRIWIGSEEGGGKVAGLGAGVRRAMIERCLGVTKSVVGMVADPGYVSMEDGEDCGEGDGGGC